MIQSMWFNLHVEDLERSEQFYRDLGFEIIQKSRYARQWLVLKSDKRL